MGVRDYDVKINQFLIPDPLYLEAPSKCVARPVNCNLYSYAMNSPLNFVDPGGADTEDIQGLRPPEIATPDDSQDRQAMQSANAPVSAAGPTASGADRTKQLLVPIEPLVQSATKESNSTPTAAARGADNINHLPAIQDTTLRSWNPSPWYQPPPQPPVHFGSDTIGDKIDKVIYHYKMAFWKMDQQQREFDHVKDIFTSKHPINVGFKIINGLGGFLRISGATVNTMAQRTSLPTMTAKDSAPYIAPAPPLNVPERGGL
jgi:hypothetical protein